MDGLHEFLEIIRRQHLARGNLLGFLHVLIGRRIATAEGVLVSPGTTWRTLAQALKRVRWDKESIRELGFDPRQFPPRDRERFWYSVIAQAHIDSAAAAAAGDRFAAVLAERGYRVGPAPRSGTS